MAGQPYPPPMRHARARSAARRWSRPSSLYAAGYFPMDDPERGAQPAALLRGRAPCGARARRGRRARPLRRRVRRSLRAGEDADWRLVARRALRERSSTRARARASPATACGSPPRLQRLYRRLYEAGLAHSLRDRGRRRARRRPARRPPRPRGDARVDVPPRPRRGQRAAGAHPRRARRARLRAVRHPAADRAHHPHGRAARGARGLRGAAARGALS